MIKKVTVYQDNQKAAVEKLKGKPEFIIQKVYNVTFTYI